MKYVVTVLYNRNGKVIPKSHIFNSRKLAQSFMEGKYRVEYDSLENDGIQKLYLNESYYVDGQGYICSGDDSSIDFFVSPACEHC